MKFKQLYLHKRYVTYSLYSGQYLLSTAFTVDVVTIIIRKALYLAYNTLTGPEGITFHDFLLFMQHYRPRMSKHFRHFKLWMVPCMCAHMCFNWLLSHLMISLAEFEAMCTFKALHNDHSAHVQPYQGISREEFYSFYEVQGMRWKQVSHTTQAVRACVVHNVLANRVDQH